MAGGMVRCQCKKCGVTFYKFQKTHIHDIHDWDDSKEWEEWANSYYHLCDNCYYKACRKKEKADGFKVIRIKYRDYMTLYRKCRKVANSYDKATKSVEIVVSPEQFREIKATGRLISVVCTEQLI
ncbi:hypothetical protein ABXS75_03160 [Roseburia hominis]